MRTNFFILSVVFFLFSVTCNAFEVSYVTALNQTSFTPADNVLPKLKITNPYASSTSPVYSYKVSLKYTRSQLTDIVGANPWNYKMTLVLKMKDAAGNLMPNTATFDLSLSFAALSDPTNSIYEDVFLLDNQFAGINNPTAELFITAFSATNTGTPPTDIALELTQIQTITDTFNPLAPINFNKTSNNKTIFWEYITGAQSYDLEWVYIDAYDVVTTFTQNADPFSAKEPVRISTALQTFTFHNTYSKGKIYFRVRATKIDATTNLITAGNWNYNVATLIVNSDDFEGYKNLQVSTVFIENGRYKKSITYADGSSRARQSQTSMNSDNTVIISETKYDFEGRPVVNVMPFPYAASTSMNHVANVNTFNVATPTDHQKKAYDDTAKSLTLSTASGASQYYSVYNSFPFNATRSYTPDAQGYPYSQVIYTPDNTGRVARQNTVGAAFRMEVQPNETIQDQHFVQNYYGTPSSTELYRMFGNNVGAATHYTKNYSIDENGVISIQYLDGAGKVIASALNERQTSNLDSITDLQNKKPLYDGGLSIHRLSDQNEVNAQARVSISTDKIINLVSGQKYTFKYDLSSVLNAQDGACLTCGYTVEISVIGPDGKSILKEATAPYNIMPYYSQALLPTVSGCSTATYPTIQLVDIPFNLLGEYTVSKKLYYNASSVGTLNNTVAGNIPVQMTFDNVVYTNKAAFVAAYTDKMLTVANCTFTCEGNCENYKKTFVNKINPETGLIYTSAKLAQIKTQCMTECGAEVTNLESSIPDMRCASYKQQMLDQLSPDGYYYTKAGWVSGIYSAVPFTQVDGISPTLADVMNPVKFNSIWATDMLNKHPEYCVYNNLCANTIPPTAAMTALKNRDQYEIYKLGSETSSWSDAGTKGYLRPINMTAPSFTVPGLPSFSLGSVPTSQLDPFFTNISSGALQTQLLNYFKESAENIDYNGDGIKSTTWMSAWEYASYYYLAGNINSATGFMNMPLPALPADYDVNRWTVFKGIYLTEKDKFIKTSILSAGCTAGNGYQDPTLEQTIIRSQPATIDSDGPSSALQTWAELQTLGVRGCDDEVNKSRARSCLSLLETNHLTIYPTITQSNLDLLNYALYKYFSKGCATDNPSGYIRCEQITTDPYLIRAQQILSGYDLSLTSICTSNAYTTCSSVTSPATAHYDGLSPEYGALIDLINEYLERHRNAIETITSSIPACDWPIASVFDDISSYPSGVYNSVVWNARQYTKIAIVQYPLGTNAYGDPYQNRTFIIFKDINGVQYYSYDNTLTRARNAGVELNNLKAITNIQTLPFSIAPYTPSLNLDIVKMDNSKVNIIIGEGYTGTVSCRDYHTYNMYVSHQYNQVNNFYTPYANITSTPTTRTTCQVNYTVTTEPNPCDTASRSNDPFWMPFCMQDEIDKCTIEQTAIATEEANELWDAQLNAQLQTTLSTHYTKCFSAPFKENFYYETKELRQLYYTLYYYDQAGNLVQTVPPEGVRLLKKDAFNAKGEYLGIIQPVHGLLTKYKYNSLNQPVYKITPDESGTSQDMPSYTFYNDKGQAVLSQNPKQRVTNTFSCVSYDKLGRVSKAYDIVNTTLLTDLLDRSKYDQNVTAYWNADLCTAGNMPTDIIATTYDTPQGSDPAYTNRGRITKVSRALNLANLNATNLDSYITYQYDIHGNVKTLSNVMPLPAPLPGAPLAFTVDYTYDLLSGSVKKMVLDKDLESQFMHCYTYDADNRLKSVKTSRNGLVWEEDARYQYYLHGPLARKELGEDRVQGTDHYYTLQGWIKGINIPQAQGTLTVGANNYNFSGIIDSGGDGAYGNNALVAQDEYMMNLGFYSGDYMPIGLSILTPLGLTSPLATANLWKSFNATGLKGLYNGNIAYWINDRSRAVNGTNTVRDNAYVFKYDQLDRIRNAYYTTALGYNSAIYEYNWAERIVSSLQLNDFSASYDLNGNIKTLQRYDGNGSLIDNLSYNYTYTGSGASLMLQNNKLTSVGDVTGSGLADYDIDAQEVNNYSYDNIGNLIGDVSEQIVNITWNREGKVTSLTRTSISTKPDFIFKYDVNGKRIYKEVRVKTPTGALDPANYKYVYYAYDGTGNLLATYDRVAIYLPIDIRQVDVNIFGSDRLGTYTHATPVLRYALHNMTFKPVVLKTDIFQRKPGLKQYELKDHLGNVRTVITGIKIGVNITEGNTFYVADVVSENDYYPFGMMMNGGYRRNSNITYKFGYNGKPMDTDWNGEGAMYDYGFRIYDPRICKFLSVDPLSPEYPWYTPYQFAGNKPINSIDLDGLEEEQSIVDPCPECPTVVVTPYSCEGCPPNPNLPDPEKLFDVTYYGTITKMSYGGSSNWTKPLIATHNVAASFCNGIYGTLDAVINPYSTCKSIANYFGNTYTYATTTSGSQQWSEFKAAAYFSVTNPGMYEDMVAMGLSMGVGGYVPKYPTLNVTTPVRSSGSFLQGGPTFAQYKASYWATRTKPVYQPIRMSNGKVFKVYEELHHRYIPQRASWAPNWLKNNRFNLQPLNSIQHGISDPYRFQFFPSEIKKAVKSGNTFGY
jgi:RHS repeat-associated protein